MQIANSRRYHFSLGNSSYGPIGFCAQVCAKSHTEAVGKLKSALQKSTGALCEVSLRSVDESLEYLTVYFNPACIDTRHIDAQESHDRTK